MKEFSNDPSQAMSELSSLFETRMKIVQSSLNKLKTGLDNASAVRILHLLILTQAHLISALFACVPSGCT